MRIGSIVIRCYETRANERLLASGAAREPPKGGWWVHGLGRPSPLFDERTNAPRSVPRVLTRSERAAL